MTDVELEQELRRFEGLLTVKFPALVPPLPPGLDDDGIDRLSAAISPLTLPAQVETLYRWHDGSASNGIFGQWTFYGLDELLRWREFCLEELHEPPAWLQVFDDQCLGFVELGVPGAKADNGVWYGHTHDGEVVRIFDSVLELVRLCGDGIASGLFVEERGGISLEGWSLDGLAQGRWSPPGGFPTPVPFDSDWVAERSTSRSPDPGWPTAWSASLGVTSDALRFRGTTGTIAELIEQAADHPVAGVVSGRVIDLMGSADVTVFTIDDGTGRLTIRLDDRLPIGPVMRATVEVDVRIEAGATAPESSSKLDSAHASASARVAGVPATGLGLRRAT